VVDPSEASLGFESVDLLFNILGSFFNIWPLTSSKNHMTEDSKTLNFFHRTATAATFNSAMTIEEDSYITLSRHRISISSLKVFT